MITVKIGGSIVDGLDSTAIDDLKKISQSSKLVVVHGGGNQVTIIANKLGKVQGFVVSPEGVRSRYTDKETAEIYTMVMAGKLNKEIVRMLLQHDLRAAGITGVDGAVLRANRKKKLIIINSKGRKMIVDGGYTGKITSVDPSLISLLLENGYVPVISPVALSEEYDFLNVDGDRAAAYVAGALKAEKVIFITNVTGLLLNSSLVKHMNLEQARKALPQIGFGMEKKILASIEALEMGVGEAIISSGQKEYPFSNAIMHEDCTVITKK